jgi:hypothetical protein
VICITNGQINIGYDKAAYARVIDRRERNLI